MRTLITLLLLLSLAACGAPKPPEATSLLAQKAAGGDAAAAKVLVERLGGGYSVADRALAYRGLLEAGAVSMPLAAEAAKDKDEVRREHALALVGNLKVEGGFELARDALLDPSFTRSHAAAWALGELADERAIPLLVEAMAKSGPGLTARESARALTRFGEAAVPAVVARFPTFSPEVKSYAIRILGEMKFPAARPVVIASLNDPALRADAVWAVGVMGRVDPAVDLKPYLKDSNPVVRVEACRAAGLLEDRSVESVLDSMRQHDPVVIVREWAARGLGLVRGAPENYLTKENKWKEPDNLYH